jgi:KUP system potassium uptake protein
VTQPRQESGQDADSGTHARQGTAVLVLGALGVVYGDIGTSPIYAFRQAMAVRPGGPAEVELLGLISLIVWSLTLTVTVKYVFFVTRADNNGEGGTLSLMTLARKAFDKAPRWITGLGVVGAGMFVGDAMLTPAMSVLSAVEGLETVAPQMSDWVVPITLVIILGIFTVQKFGTAGVGVVFGPVTTLWFLVLGGTGLSHILASPEVLRGLYPWLGLEFLALHPGHAFAVMGAVFLAVTGAEALYVDMGHFGRRPIIIAWAAIVFPCLLLNYLGQAAYALEAGPNRVVSPFFEMQPEWARLPFIGLATMATIIASQAVISGTYSLASQAIAMNMLPRMTVLHTSSVQRGQIYMPQVNTMLMLSVLLMVVTFGSSSALATAYGIAVSGVMVMTLVLLTVVMRRSWKWPALAVTAFAAVFALIDGGFFAVNSAKVFQGGWVPVVVAAAASLTMAVWMDGRRRLSRKLQRDDVPLQVLLDSLSRRKPDTVPGTAVFLTSEIETVPLSLLHSLKHYKVLHEQNVLLTVRTSASPRVADDERVHLESFNPLFTRVIVTFGYMEEPNVPKALVLARRLGWQFDIMSTSFFLSRRTIKLGDHGSILGEWRDRLFLVLARNASDATQYFHIPTGRVVEIGAQHIL